FAWERLQDGVAVTLHDAVRREAGFASRVSGGCVVVADAHGSVSGRKPAAAPPACWLVVVVAAVGVAVGLRLRTLVAVVAFSAPLWRLPFRSYPQRALRGG